MGLEQCSEPLRKRPLRCDHLTATCFDAATEQVQHGPEDVVLALEMQVERRLGEPGLPSDIVHRAALVAIAGKQPQRRIGDLVDAGMGIVDGERAGTFAFVRHCGVSSLDKIQTARDHPN